MSALDLGVVGNCGFGALIDRTGRVVWCCLPRFDGDPVFNALLQSPDREPSEGAFALTLQDLQESEQYYEPNTAVLKTRLHGPSGSVEISDCVPRFVWRGRMFRPQSFVRRVTPLSGRPRLAVEMRPRFHYGAAAPTITHGSNHIRYVGPDFTLRLTTDVPIDYVLAERPFNLDEPINLILGPDETLSEGLSQTARHFEEQTIDYWRSWSRRLALPFDWQDAVIRAAITLKLCTYEPTGAIVAALTTSVPEAADSGRNWDYRYCWLRDAFFVVRALNSLGAVHTMENYFGWLMNIVAQTEDNHLQPVYGIGLEAALSERVETELAGYRGMGPVRVGNQAHEHFQHDVYGNLILGAVQTFFDRRLVKPADVSDFHRLESVGEQAHLLHDQPDAGMWELRSRSHVHTSSSLMCWVACDRLAKIAGHLSLDERAKFWADRAASIRKVILDQAWSEDRKAFADSFGGSNLDAGVLLMAEVGFIDPMDPRFVSTVEKLEQTLARGPHMMRYENADDFGLPETAFNICAFWRLDALSRIGRKEEAIEIFEALLATRNHLGILSEDTDFNTGEMWGNYPQTYSMVGIINGAMRLSRSWETFV
ncbi:MAG: glycoside hydrolase family 15 protein [Hyphomicrobiaceae bacterium]